MASFSGREKDWGGAFRQEYWLYKKNLAGRLLSYYAIVTNAAETRDSFRWYKGVQKRIEMKRDKQVYVFLDSGAFSAFVAAQKKDKKVEIDIHKYIQFIKDNKDCIDVYANLDVIGDAEATLKNQKLMEQHGLKPLPCFHLNEDFRYLAYYLDNYDYIALGGVAQAKNRSRLAEWLDRCFGSYICDSSGMPRVKIHGFAVTSVVMMLRYPWYSVDSTSWVIISRMGAVYVPPIRDGQRCYNIAPLKVVLSIRNPKRKESGQHFFSYTDSAKRDILQYFTDKGYQLGESEVKEESSDYQLAENERLVEKKDGKKIVEVIVGKGLCNQYIERDKLNIEYFLDFERRLPAWPWPFKANRYRGGLINE